MTSPGERRQEFFEECLDTADEVRVGAVRIDGVADQRREAERYANQADYHRDAALDNLEGRAPLMAIRQGYYVMFHKANEALALAGFKQKTHRCTLLGLRGVFNAPDLADALRRAGNERLNVDYRMNPEDPELTEFDNAHDFVTHEMEPFVDAVEDLLEHEGLR